MDENIKIAKGNLCQPTDKIRTNTGWARLRIHIDKLSKEQEEKLDQATNLLRQVGLNFDSGAGDGCYDMELDWSLSGPAHIETKPLKCMGCDTLLTNYSEFPIGVIPIDYGREGVLHFPFCSNECFEKEKQMREQTAEEKGKERPNISYFMYKKGEQS